MNHVISNHYLTVTIAELGAEIQSIEAADGTQFFWNGEKSIWPKHGPNLFPYLANLTDGKYTFEGKTYEMGLHGFVPYSVLSVREKSSDQITFVLQANETTLACYPFTFQYQVTYALEENKLKVTYTVDNQDSKTMYFGIGGHPGFHMPIDPSLTFEDYHLTFQQTCNPTRITFSDRGGVTGEIPYPIHDNKIALNHRLFDDNAIVLKGAGHSILISSDKSPKSIRVTFPSMPYVGIWHKAKSDVPFLCIEPWSSLPSRDGIVEDLAKQDNLVPLCSGMTYVNTWSMEFTTD